MDFDESEYLKKRVKETNGSSKKDKEAERERREKGYRRERSFDEFGEEDRERKSSSKKSRIEEKESDRDKERKRRSNRDRDRERSSGHRSQHRDSERRSLWDKVGDRDRKRRESDRERERERERIEREKERERRSRSRSKMEREMQVREREENRRYKDKKEAVEPEPAPEREQKTVFAYQIRLQANERDVFEFFSKAGKVRDVKLIMYQNKSKGVGYIEFYDAMSVPMALALSGHLFMGQPILVKPSEAEKNLVRSTATGGSVAGPHGATDRKLYIGKLQFNMTESRLKQIFEAFGPVELAQLSTDPETGHCKGFGFIQFAKLEHSKAAQSLDGKLEIAGRTITISSFADHVAAQDSGTKTAEFDDDGGGGLAQSKASGIGSSVDAEMINPTAPEEAIGTPSECLLLKNVFDPSVEMEADFDVDLRDDVAEECSKYGKVKHAHVDSSSSAGCVYLSFVGVEAASRAQQAMHKGFFGLRLISAIFLQPYEYDAKVKGSA